MADIQVFGPSLRKDDDSPWILVLKMTLVAETRLDLDEQQRMAVESNEDKDSKRRYC